MGWMRKCCRASRTFRAGASKGSFLAIAITSLIRGASLPCARSSRQKGPPLCGETRRPGVIEKFARFLLTGVPLSDSQAGHSYLLLQSAR